MAQLIRPYGDRQDDGAVQLSFTLPVDAGPRAREAARLYVEKLGFRDVLVTAMEPAGTGYTLFVAYGRHTQTIDYAAIDVPVVKTPNLGRTGVDRLIERHLKRKLVVVGGCTGADAHTVGIDAIMNMKGYDGDYGMERYKWFEAYNLGSQLGNDHFLDRAKELNADVVLLSQVVTQRDCHKENARALIELAKERGMREDALYILGGPRLDHKTALELGFDAGFGPGTVPSEVASYIILELLHRRGLDVDIVKVAEEAAASKGGH